MTDVGSGLAQVALWFGFLHHRPERSNLSLRPDSVRPLQSTALYPPHVMVCSDSKLVRWVQVWHVGQPNVSVVTTEIWGTHVVDVLFLSASHRISAPSPTTSVSHQPGTPCQHASLSLDPRAGHSVAYQSGSSSTPRCPCVTCWGELARMHVTEPSQPSTYFLSFHFLAYVLFASNRITHSTIFFGVHFFNQPWDYHVYPPPS